MTMVITATVAMAVAVRKNAFALTARDCVIARLKGLSVLLVRYWSFLLFQRNMHGVGLNMTGFIKVFNP